MPGKKRSLFDKLREKISAEYEAKGIPPEKAEDWGTRTAAKIAAKKEAQK